MADLNYIVWPTDSTEEEMIGGKAFALSALSLSFGHLIPPWFAINKDAFLVSTENHSKTESILLDDSVRAQLISAIDHLKQQSGEDVLFAVRSSAIGEDSACSSYAGQLESVLNVTANDIESAVIKVWRSAQEQHIDDYQQQTGQTKSLLLPAVLVQVMIPAQVAGVGFGVDPVSGSNKRLVISACEGLGDKLVSGLVDGDTYCCDRDGSLVEHLYESQPLLTPEKLNEISNLLIKLEDFFGKPQDIEWAYAEEQLWLLQSRPITTIYNQPNIENDVSPKITGVQKILWDNSNIVESYSGITSPLTFSFARYVYENVYTEFCRFMGIGNKRIVEKHNLFRNMLGSLNGHVYYNLLNWYEWLALFPGFTLNRRFMEQMMGVSEPVPDEFIEKLLPKEIGFLDKLVAILRLSRSGFGLVYNALVLRYKVKRFNRRLDEALAMSAEKLQDMPLDELANQYRLLEQKLLRHWDAPLINDFLCMMAFGLSRKLLQKYGGDEGIAYHRDMLIGQGDIISAEPAMRIREMAQNLCAHPELISVFCSADKEEVWNALKQAPQLKAMIQKYLDKFGDRCLQELKLESPTMKDEPETLFSSIGYLASRLQEGEVQIQNRTVLPALETVIGQGKWRNFSVRYICQWAKNLVSGRENLRFERTRVFGRVRQIFVQIGKRFTELNLLENEQDIFYLQVDEILGLIEGSAVSHDIGSLIRLRKKENLYYHQQPDLPSRLVTQGAVFCAMAAQNIKQQTSVDSTQAEHDSLQGVACCQGVVRAKVRVITDPRKAKLKSGEIMVAKFTDPGWITLFANASGILVERGSLLSHSAIVARELNIPAIVGIKGVMEWLKTGDIVEMDGGSGSVFKIINE